MSALVTIEQAVQEAQKDYGKTEGWETVAVSWFPVSHRKELFVRVSGMTPEPHRFFMTWFWLYPAKFENIPFIKGNVLNALASLDSFLDPQCKCVPGPDGQLGKHCEYHLKLYGY